MYTNIDINHLDKLYQREPEAKLVIDTLTENHMRIIGTLSHEIRNPLTLLYGNMQLLQNSLPELMNNKLWTAAVEDFEYTHALLDELSLYNNSHRLQIHSVDANDFFSKLALSFASSLSDTSITFTSSISELPEVMFDPIKIKSVIINIFKNAKEATSLNETIHLSVSTTIDMLNIEITDTGLGIPADQLDTIFNPFTSYKQGGTGLGLAICNEIIRAHDGTIKVISDLGVGTSFRIQLPLW